MYFSKNEYKETMRTFLEDHHGQIIKLRDQNNEIFSYIIRCEAIPGKKDLISFGIVFNVFYINPSLGRHKINSKELKFYGVRRVMEKWKNIKEIDYMSYAVCSSEETFQGIKTDLEFVKGVYDGSPLNHTFDIEDTAKYIFKCLKNIKNYYKNENIDNFKLILI